MKAIALISGGLDSHLAAKFMQQQGIEVIGVNFKIPFNFNKPDKVLDFGFEIKAIDIGESFLELLKNPHHGFGANMNPCIDCKILMLRKAKELMPQLDAKFIITGEVLGQRPMSQNRQSLEIIEKRSGLESLLLRPLSAKLLKETMPEKEGWVKRDNLLDFNGRTRKAQMELAKSLGIDSFAQPAGGCLLTDPEFARKLKDLIKHEGLTLDNIELLKIGRHFRLLADTKLVVGRNELEDNKIVDLARKGDYLFMPKDIAGPTSLLRGGCSDDLFKLSCNITCRYCDLNGKDSAEIIYRAIPDQEEKVLRAKRLEAGEVEGFRI